MGNFLIRPMFESDSISTEIRRQDSGEYIDELMIPIINYCRSKSLQTLYCCSGHIDGLSVPYIMIKLSKYTDIDESLFTKLKYAVVDVSYGVDGLDDLYYTSNMSPSDLKKNIDRLIDIDKITICTRVHISARKWIDGEDPMSLTVKHLTKYLHKYEKFAKDCINAIDIIYDNQKPYDVRYMIN